MEANRLKVATYYVIRVSSRNFVTIGRNNIENFWTNFENENGFRFVEKIWNIDQLVDGEIVEDVRKKSANLLSV